MHYDSPLPIVEKLFSEPDIAFIQINRTSDLSIRSIFTRYSLFSLFVAIMVGVSRYYIHLDSMQYFLKKAIIEPTVMVLGLIMALYLLSIIIRESLAYFGSKSKDASVMKVCFCSGMPFLSMVPFTFLPVVGRFILMLATLHWIYLIWIGSKTILFFPSAKLMPWVITILFSLFLAIFLLLIFINLFDLFLRLF